MNWPDWADWAGNVLSLPVKYLAGSILVGNTLPSSRKG